MKTTRKIIVFVLMLAVIFSAMGMFAVSASAEDSETIRVYFENNWGWGDIRIHYWGGSSGSTWGTSGESLPKMTDSGLTTDSGTKIYYYDVPADSTGMLFKRLDDDGRATWDITSITPCTIWCMEWDGTDNDGKDNAKFYKSDKVHSYVSEVTTEATCDKAGVRTYTCSACKNSYTEAITELPGHNYVDGACTACGATEGGETTEPDEDETAESLVLYLTPNTNWHTDNARFAAAFLNSDKSVTEWADAIDSNNNGVYEIVAPAGEWKYVIFCRMNPSATENNWDNKWNQTADLDIPTDGTNYYTVAADTWDNGGGVWSALNSYDIVYADESGTVNDPGVWHFWNDQNWCGSNVTVSNAKYDGEADKATFTYTLEGSCSYGMQVFYESATNVTDKTYKITCTITSEAAGEITINAQAVTLVAGENKIELTVVEGANNNSTDAPDASFSLQCGNITANTFSISDLTFTLVEENEGEEGGNESTDTSNPVFGEQPKAVANPGAWYYWNDQNWCGSNVTVSNANYDAESGKVTLTYSGATSACWFGMQLFYEHPSNVTGTTYNLTCTINSKVAGDITINGQVVTLVAGENKIKLTVIESADASFRLQCGNEAAGTVISENTLTISDLKFTQDYYLVGWINSADYSGEDYKFVDGKLVVTFTAAENWVAIKPATGGWYMFSAACYTSSGDLAQGNAEKMKVPGNVEITFTLVENADGTLTLSYTKPASAVDPNANYTVAGVTSLTGVYWDANSADNKMTFDAANNVFVKVYTGIAAGKHQIKVVKDNNWNTCYGGAGAGGNFDVDVTLGNSTVTVIFNPIDDSISYTETHVHDMAAATCTLPSTCKYCTYTEGEANGHSYSEGTCSACGGTDPSYCGHTETKVVNTATCTEAGVTYTACAKCDEPLSEEKEVAALGHTYDKYGYCGVCNTGVVHTVAGVKELCGNAWNVDDENNNLIFDPETGIYSITYNDIPAGTYEFKVVKNHDWTGAYDNGAGGNYLLTTYETLDITISIVDSKLVVKCYDTLASEAVYYFIPGEWENDGAVFAIYCFDKNPGGLNAWVALEKVDGHDYYRATVPAGYSHMIFVRLDPAATEPNWDAKWNQTNDLALSAEGGTYRITSIGSDGANSEGEWHTHAYTPAVTAPTCTTDGYTTHTCACGDSYTDSTVPALTHDWADATCTDPKTCKRTGCGATEGEKLGHDLTVYPAVDPTCTEKGLTAGEKCNRTGCTHNVPQTEVAAKGHDFDEWTVTTEATEDTNGEKRRDCKNCDHYETDVIPKLNHDCSRHETTPIPAVPATCTTPGSTAGEKCSECGATVKAPETIPALNHNLVDDAAVAPTCTEAGLTAGKHCTRCDYKVAQEEIAALGHNMTTDAAVAPTCTETGLTEGSHCVRCDHKVAQEVVAALGHTEVVDAAVAATCTEKGLTEGKHCSVCNVVTVAQEVVAALGHTEVVDAAVESTCTKTGLTEGKHCSVCNEVLVAQKTVSIKPHSYAEGKCSVCGATDPDYVAPHEHNFVDGECECGEKDPNYVAPTPDSEPGFFESIWQAILDFFKSIGDFFVNLFSGGKE